MGIEPKTFSFTRQCYNVLENPPMFRHPDEELPYVLQTDASQIEMVAVLHQEKVIWKRHVISYSGVAAVPDKRSRISRYCLSCQLL